MKIRLDAIAFDAGTQIREAIDQQVVGDYADAMTSGAAFPPIVLFHDGTQHYLADGFHRFMAARRNQFREIEAEVKPGTKEDALWFALGANRKNGKRLTSTDLQHAIWLAFQTWPDKSTHVIAEQVGCAHPYVMGIRQQVVTSYHLPDRVTGKDGKSYPATKTPATPKPAPEHPKFKSRAAVQQRREQMREMATDGHTSRQIADALGLSEEGCRETLRRLEISVPADLVVGKSKKHDANRIVEQMVMDAENLTADVNLIDFAALDRNHLSKWADSLIASKKALDGFIRRLIKEKQKHDQAA